MTNAWTLVTSSPLNLTEVEAVAIDDGRGHIRIMPAAGMEALLRDMEIGPLSTPTFTLWTSDYMWAPVHTAVPLELGKVARHPELWAIDRAQRPLGDITAPIPDMKAEDRMRDLAGMLGWFEEDRAEVLATAPVLEPSERGDPGFNIGLLLVGTRVETIVAADHIVDGNVDLSLLKILSRHDDAARRMRHLLELRRELTR